MAVVRRIRRIEDMYLAHWHIFVSFAALKSAGYTALMIASDALVADL